MPFIIRFLLPVVLLFSARSHGASIVSHTVSIASGDMSRVQEETCDIEPAQRGRALSPDAITIALNSRGHNLAVHRLTLKGQPSEIYYLTPPIPLVREAMVCENERNAMHFKASLGKGGVVTYKGALDSTGQQTVTFTVHSDTGPLTPISLASRSDYEFPEASYMLYWLLLGGLFAICLYNSFLWLGANKKLYKYNVAYTCSIMILNFVVGHGAIVSVKILRDLGYSADILIRIYAGLNNSSGVLSGALVLFFACSLIEVERLSIKLHRFIQALYRFGFILTAFAAAYALVTGDAQLFNPAPRLYGLVVSLVTITYLPYVYFRFKDRFALLLFIAYLPFATGASLFIGFLDGTIEGNILTRNGSLIGCFLEALFLSFTVGYRMHLIEKQALTAEKSLASKLASLNDDLEKKVASHIGDIKAMMDNIAEAVFMIDLGDDGGLYVSEEKSRFATVLFGLNKVEARIPFAEVIQKVKLTREQADTLMTVIMTSIGGDLFCFEINSHQYPRRALTTDEREVELNFSPVISDSGKIERFLCVIRDVTEKIAAEEAAARADRDNRIMLEILRNPLSRARSNIQVLSQILSEIPMQIAHEKDFVMRQLHTAKGVARTFFYDLLSERIHELEGSVLESGMKPKEAIDGSLNALREYEFICLTRLQSDSNQSAELHMRKWKGHLLERLDAVLRSSPGIPVGLPPRLHHTVMETTDGGFFSEWTEQFKGEIKRLAVILNKEMVAVNIAHDVPLVLDIHNTTILLGIVTHLIRNSLDHGIELPSERMEAQKPVQGNIHISILDSSPAGFRFEFTDDGRGIDVMSLKGEAEKMGLSRQGEEGILEVLFAAGFSSKSEASMISGRGVGLDAVRFSAEKSGGFARARFGRHLPGQRREIIFEICVGTLKSAIQPVTAA